MRLQTLMFMINDVPIGKDRRKYLPLNWVQFEWTLIIWFSLKVIWNKYYFYCVKKSFIQILKQLIIFFVKTRSNFTKIKIKQNSLMFQNNGS